MDYPLIDELSTFVSETTFDSLPDLVIEETIRIILDSVGCAFAGMSHDRGRIGRDFGMMQPGSDATILGTGEKASIFGAAFANAEAINALDFDAVLPPGHVSPYVLPPALAIAELVGSSGKDLIVATAIAHELSNRIGKAMDYTRDVKDGKVALPVVWGFASTVFGAAAAVSKLRSHSLETISNAISLAGLTSPVNSACAWRDHVPSTTIKYGSGGIATTGISTAFMAELGHRGDAQIFEPEVGYPRFIGTRRWAPEATIKDIGKVWNFPRENSFKPYPHCRVLHAPLDALRDIIRRHNIKPDEIEGIKAWVEGILTQPIWLNNDITHVTEAQFSVAHGLALGAHGFAPGPEWQDPANVHAPSVLELMKRVEYVVHPDYVKMITSDSLARPTRVEVRARGELFVEERSHPKGTSKKESDFYYSSDELMEKFLSNAGYVLAEGKALRLAAGIQDLIKLDNVRDLMKIIH